MPRYLYCKILTLGSSVPTVIDLDDVLPGTKKAKKAKTSKNNQEEDEQPDAASSSKKVGKYTPDPLWIEAVMN